MSENCIVKMKVEWEDKESSPDKCDGCQVVTKELAVTQEGSDVKEEVVFGQMVTVKEEVNDTPSEYIVKMKAKWGDNEIEESPLVLDKNIGGEVVMKEVAVMQGVDNIKEEVVVKEEITVGKDCQLKQEVDDTPSEICAVKCGDEGEGCIAAHTDGCNGSCMVEEDGDIISEVGHETQKSNWKKNGLPCVFQVQLIIDSKTRCNEDTKDTSLKSNQSDEDNSNQLDEDDSNQSDEDDSNQSDEDDSNQSDEDDSKQSDDIVLLHESLQGTLSKISFSQANQSLKNEKTLNCVKCKKKCHPVDNKVCEEANIGQRLGYCVCYKKKFGRIDNLQIVKGANVEGKSHQRKQFERSCSDTEVHTIHEGLPTLRDKQFHCQYCDRVFSKSYLLKRHERTHTNDKKVKMSVKLTKHERTHKCRYCFKYFSNSFVMKLHEGIHKEKCNCNICSKVSCRDCKSSDKSALHAENKRKIGKQQLKEIKCKYCSKQFSNLFVLKLHEGVHTGEELWGKGFCLTSDLKIHERIHKKNQCKRIFSCSSHLKRCKRTHKKVEQCKGSNKNVPLTGNSHKIEVEDKSYKRYHCKYCDKSFITLVGVKFHEQLHIGEKPSHCEFCDKTFCMVADLKEHERTHTGEKSYECNVCEKGFNYKRHLKVHEKIHTGGKTYKCNVCEKAFNYRRHLKEHEKIHTGGKPYKCNVCEKVFNCRRNLKVHERIHTGGKLYKCNVCEKAFNYRRHLKEHEKIHTSGKPYKCYVCEKVFNCRRNLKVHERIHTGGKPYKCDVCEKVFNYKRHLKEHERIHIGGKLYKCNVCEKVFSCRRNLQVHEKTHTLLQSCSNVMFVGRRLVVFTT